jgi:hypothetical protein
MVTTPLRTARYVMGDGSLSIRVHQVRKAQAVWHRPGEKRWRPEAPNPFIHVTTLCKIWIGGGRKMPVFARTEEALPGVQCRKCAEALTHMRGEPEWIT